MAVRPAIKRVPKPSQAVRGWSTFTIATRTSRKRAVKMSGTSRATSGSLASSRRNPAWLRGWLMSCIASLPAVASCDSAPATLTLQDDGVAAPGLLPRHCTGTDVWTKPGCVHPADIKVNSVGYLPGRTKLATLTSNTSESTFAVRNLITQEVAYSGSLTENAIDVPDTGESVKWADFTGLTQAGTYAIEVTGLPASPQFEISDSVYAEVLKSSLLGLSGQRCGSSVTFEYGGDTFAHGNCHQTDAAFNSTFITGKSGNQDARGGWHDAGDYRKYTVNGAFSVAFLVKAWEDFGQPLASIDHIPGGSGGVPSILAEAKYQRRRCRASAGSMRRGTTT